jgi:hypothetical protein
VTAVAGRAGSGPARGDGPPDLGSAVRVALGHLVDLTHPSEAVRDGRVDRMLRDALESPASARFAEAVGAVRTACAYLAAGELEDAYLALRTALDRLPRRATGPAS